VFGALEALLITDTFPLITPRLLGENTTVNVDRCPAPIVSGRAAPEIVNPFATVLACVMLTFDPLELEMVTDCETVPPTATEPKLTVVGETERDNPVGPFPGFDEFLALVRPIQPVAERIQQSNKSRNGECARLVDSRNARIAMQSFNLPIKTVLIARIVICRGHGALLY
jgi:hypothetical protein